MPYTHNVIIPIIYQILQSVNYGSLYLITTRPVPPRPDDLPVPAAPPPTAATPLDGIAKREKIQEEMYIARTEAALLGKLRSKLAGMKKTHESPSDRLKDATRRRKATRTGSCPLQACQRCLGEDCIRRMKAEVPRLLREKK